MSRREACKRLPVFFCKSGSVLNWPGVQMHSSSRGPTGAGPSSNAWILPACQSPGSATPAAWSSPQNNTGARTPAAAALIPLAKPAAAPAAFPGAAVERCVSSRCSSCQACIPARFSVKTSRHKFDFFIHHPPMKYLFSKLFENKKGRISSFPSSFPRKIFCFCKLIVLNLESKVKDQKII